MLNWLSQKLWSKPSTRSIPPVSPLPSPASQETSGKKPDLEERVPFLYRVATIDDVVLALRICRLRGGEGKAWCRVIGDWSKFRLTGVVGILRDEPAFFILGYLRGKYFHIKHWTASPSLNGFDAGKILFSELKERMPAGVRNIMMTVDERDHDTHLQLSELHFKAMEVRHDWYSKDHHGILFEYPMGRFEE